MTGLLPLPISSARVVAMLVVLAFVAAIAMSLVTGDAEARMPYCVDRSC